MAPNGLAVALTRDAPMTVHLEPGSELPPRTVVARNTAADEAESIHDDAYAARLGYRGGLVPGVTLLAYLTSTLLDAFGDPWPRSGRLRARFVRPAYEGESLAVHATVARRDDRFGGVDVSLKCRLVRPDGDVCVEAEGSCLLGDAPPPKPGPWRNELPAGHPRIARADDDLPPLRPEALVVREELSPLTYRVTAEEAIAWAAQAGDEHPLYRDASPAGERPIVHPAFFAADPIHLVRHNFAHKATIHAASDLAYQGVGWVDSEYTVYGYIAKVYERKGNHYLVVDTLTVDQDGREIVRNRHTSLIRLRAETEHPV